MARGQKFDKVNLSRAWPVWSVILVLTALGPATIYGQKLPPAKAGPTVTPTPRAVYLPLIQVNHTFCSNVPAVPVLEAPSFDGIIVMEQVATFEWSAPDNCATNQRHYALQIATDPTFKPDSIVYGVGYGANSSAGEGRYYDTRHQLPYADKGIYFWRVAAFEGEQSSGWSSAHRVTVVSVPIAQLLNNPSFETNAQNVLPWQWLVPEVTYEVRADGQHARDGQQYLIVNRQNQAIGKKSFFQDIVQPQPGKTYHFSIWVRASSEAIEANKPRTGRIELWAHGGPAQREHSTRNFQVNDSFWHCLETPLKVSQAGHAYLRAEVYLTSLDQFDYIFDWAALRNDGQATCPLPPSGDASTLVSHGQGFDTCAAPTVSQLAAWRQASPYDYLGIYLGGANHYAPCKSHNQQFQTSTWFSAVSQQGWRFLPIWVGPQAPCTTYAVRLSSDPAVARGEGVIEARQALDAARKLGLIRPGKPGTIIYFDMEYFPANSTCHNAVNAFLEGWVSELQSQGHKAGIYGSVRTVNDWYKLGHVPDSVWVPWYIRDSYDPGLSVDVVNQGWITPSYWDNHRLFQYSNGHDEWWGGIRLNIDNDTARGLVALEDGLGSERPTIREMQLLSPFQGWLWLNQQLFWTDTAGEQWTNITPPDTSILKGVFFRDPSHGWIMSTSDRDRRLQLWRTTDGGKHWQTLTFNLDQTIPIDAAYFDFIDPHTGWLVIKLATSPNFSQGLLFKTRDGGLSWSQLTIPLGEPVRFVGDAVGWIAGGPTKSELYVTRDGGQTWLAQTIASQLPAGGYAAYGLPAFENPQQGAMVVTIARPQQTQFEFYVTHDEGRSWQLADRATVGQNLALGSRLPIHISDSQHWIVADPALTPTFPANIVDMNLVTATFGWAHTREYTCSDQCGGYSSLFKTEDGGQTWTRLLLPAGHK